MQAGRGDNPSKILVVRPGALGDTILTLPLVESIRHDYPHARITLLGNRTYRDILPSAIELIPFDGPEWLWLFSSDEQAVPAHAPRFDRAYVILQHPEQVAGNLRRAGTPHICTASPAPEGASHLVAQIHLALGFPVPPRRPSLLHLAQPGKHDLIWMHPGSGSATKCLPLDLMIRVVETLQRRTGYRLAMTLGEDDAFLTASDQWSHLTGLPGLEIFHSRALADIAANLAGAAIYVGNDSGISHFAAGLGVRSLVFFVTTDPVGWSPWVPAEQLCSADLRGDDRDVTIIPTVIEDILQRVV
ncbi:MAG: glycosyltransferase family 9 protein [Desulfomonile tiedjei]|nr:glycosyltransferase family 9 protein [Desulfomonile tiedjei]